ncbi:MAG: cytochrome c3 family protein [Gemmatimonadaceae bacterium]
MKGVAIGVLLAATLLVPALAAAQDTSVPPRPVSAARVDTSNECLLCHAAQREAATAGIHAQQGIQCVDCHGGNAAARTLPAAHQGQYIGSPNKVQTALLCGSCHSDPNRMRQYGLPTGQLSQFRTSKHGQLLFGRNDTDAPTCADCHGTHIIYPPYDARSRVYPTNIPSTCAHCHADTTLMAKYHLRTDQFAQFRESAHGVALFQKHDFAAPTCISCHGAHSALPPTGTQVANVCGQCHALVKQAFAQGPHGAAERAGKLKGCLACHTNHSTEVVPIEKIGETCGKCHAAGSRPNEMGVDLQRTAAQASRDMQSAQQAVDAMARAGRQVGYYRFRYQEAVTYYQQIAQAQHSLDTAKVDDLARKVTAVSVSLTNAADATQEQQWEHKLLLLPVWFLSLSAMLLAWLALRAVRKRHDDQRDG